MLIRLSTHEDLTGKPAMIISGKTCKFMLAVILYFAPGNAITQTVTHKVSGPSRYAPSSSLSLVPEPEGGSFADAVFSDEYFRLVVPLPSGWRENEKGPVPSAGGYYVLGRFRTSGELRGTIAVDAQDIFFADPVIESAMEFSHRKEHQAAFMFEQVIDHPPQSTKIAGHDFVRLDYNGAGYHHASFSTVVRCHVVNIEIMSRFPDVFKQAEDNMSRISLLDIPNPASGGGPVPVCVKDYATDANMIYRVEPEMVGPRYTKVPARFVIDTSGKVKHIHVINALPIQARSVQEALAQWVFKPYVQNGHPVEVETGILFEFPPSNRRPAVTAVSH